VDNFDTLSVYIKNNILLDLKHQALLTLYESNLSYFVNNSFKLNDGDVEIIKQTSNIYPFQLNYINNYKLLDIFNEKDIAYYADKKIPIFNINFNITGIEYNKIKNKIELVFKNGLYNIDKEEENINNYEENIQDDRHNIPAENMLEKISVKTRLNPISVYSILKNGIENENWNCKREEKQIASDVISIIILRLFGHRWPQQIEAKELVPEWADPNGIILLTEGFDQPTLSERVRERVAADLKVDTGQFDREFNEIIGVSLEDWIKSSFFKHHVSQFKKRPVVWQLESKLLTRSGKGRGRRKASIRDPAFSCFVYYHELDSDLLRKIQTQYVGPLKSRYETELRTLEGIGNPLLDQSERIIILRDMVEELKDFNSRLESVIFEGFDFNKLKEICSNEPLDKWTSADGIRSPPMTSKHFHLQEREYNPDINDGVRVNIAPLQKAGLLSSDVLANKDLDQAISDRAEWRADERRWCREGKLPQPGWWRKT